MYKHVFMADWKRRSSKPTVNVTGMVSLKWPRNITPESASKSNEKLRECLLASKRTSDDPLSEREKNTLSGLYTRYKMTDHGGLTNGLVVVHHENELSKEDIERWLRSLPPESRKSIIKNNKLV